MSRGRYSLEEQAFYRAYLNSPAWRRRKEARLNKAGRRCEWVTANYETGQDVRCARTRYLCVHHNTYERLGAEYDSDLDVYCWLHHMLEHLLWEKCVTCSAPCLENEVIGERWLTYVLSTLNIDLDLGSVDWKRLPNKGVLLAYVPHHCPQCHHYLKKDDM